MGEVDAGGTDTEIEVEDGHLEVGRVRECLAGARVRANGEASRGQCTLDSHPGEVVIFHEQDVERGSHPCAPPTYRATSAAPSVKVTCR